MNYDGMPMDVVNIAYQIIDMHKQNMKLERDLEFMTQQRDQWCEMANAGQRHNKEMFGEIIRATLIPALDGNALGYTEGTNENTQ